jgi:hypothetical protein
MDPVRTGRIAGGVARRRRRLLERDVGVRRVEDLRGYGERRARAVEPQTATRRRHTRRAVRQRPSHARLVMPRPHLQLAEGEPGARGVGDAHVAHPGVEHRRLRRRDARQRQVGVDGRDRRRAARERAEVERRHRARVREVLRAEVKRGKSRARAGWSADGGRGVASFAHVEERADSSRPNPAKPAADVWPRGQLRPRRTPSALAPAWPGRCCWRRRATRSRSPTRCASRDHCPCGS